MKKKLQLTTIAMTLSLLLGCGTEEGSVRPALKIMDNAQSGGTAIAFNGVSDTVASGGNSGRIKLWELPDGQAKAQWKAHGDSVTGIFFLGEGGELVSAGYDGDVALWGKGGEAVRRWKTPSPITAFAILPQQNQAVTGHKDGWTRVWNLADGVLVAERQMQKGIIKSLAVSPAGDEIAAADGWSHMAIWRREGNEVKSYDSTPSHSRALAYSPDGQAIYGSGWFNLYRWSRDSGKLEVIPTDHHGIINGIQFTPDGKLASISRQTDSAVRILDPQNGKTLAAYQKHDLCGGKIAVSPNGCFLATNSDDATVRLYAGSGSGCAIPGGGLIGLR